MNRNLTKKNKPSYKAVVFWSLISLLTLAFVGFVVYKYIDSREVNSYEVMTNLKEEQIFKQEGTYYVYVYSRVGVTENKTELEKAEDLEEAILKYLTYSKRNSQAIKMYGMIVDSGTGTYENYRCLVEGDTNTDVVGKGTFDSLRINKEDLPILMKVENGKIKSAFLQELDIREELQQAMDVK